MGIKNGVAYSGSVEECGTLKQKIDNSKEHRMPVIQIRAGDILEMLRVERNGKTEEELTLERESKRQEVVSLLKGFSGEISVHLTSPKWTDGHLDPKSMKRNISMVTLLTSLGVMNYTIHPHINRIEYCALSEEEKKARRKEMAQYFSKLVSAGANLAIENIPVRNIEEIMAMPEGSKKDKNLRNISYGMTEAEIRDILYLTREYMKSKKGDPEKVGITLDTGHALAKTPYEEREQELEKWFKAFPDDIRIIHITPGISRNEDGSTSVKHDVSQRTMEWVYGLAQKYGVNGLFLSEAHASLESMTELYNMQCETAKRHGFSSPGPEPAEL